MDQRIDLMTGLNYHITQREITRRHNLIREYMKRKDIGVLLVLAPQIEGYRRWLSGVDGTERKIESCFVVPEHGDILHVIGGRMVRAEEAAGKPVGTQPDPEEAFLGIKTVYYFSAFEIRRMFRSASGKKLGFIHGDEIRAQMYDYLQEFLPDVGRMDVTGEFAELKAVKSPEELALMERAVSLQERVLEGLWGYLKPGMLEAEAVRYARYLATRLGSGGLDAMEYAQVDLISWNGEQVKGPLIYPGRRLGQGDMIQICLRLLGDSGYYGTLTRCISLGEPPEKEREFWKLAVFFQDMIVSKLGPGVTLRELRKTVQELADEHSVLVDEKHFVHGIGYTVSEFPDRQFGLEDTSFQEGMVVAVEPKIKDRMGNEICCGDIYRITAAGAVRMTKLAREIKVL